MRRTVRGTYGLDPVLDLGQGGTCDSVPVSDIANGLRRSSPERLVGGVRVGRLPT